MVDQKKAYAYAIIVVLIWSTVASAFKISLRYLNYLQLLFYASLISLLILFIILIFQNKLSLLKTYSKKDYLHSAILGLLNPFLYYIVLFKAYSLLSAQQAVSLNYTWAIQIVLLSVPLLKQKIGFKSVLAIIISYVGVLIISTQGDILALRVTNLYGVLLALGSAVIWALFWIYNIKDKRDEVVKLFLNFLFGFIFILIAIVFSKRLIIPKIPGFTSAVYIGLFEMGITFVLWLKALKLSKTTAQVSNLIYLTPFLSLLIINIMIGEKILISTIIGLILIVMGIIMQQYNTRPFYQNKVV
ncbi:MAG: DMT family transporter [Candidatus Stahlbacteria bacterium]|nr:MAG: DMT family transporter [Candidatus Stahlbacteria bacterium]